MFLEQVQKSLSIYWAARAPHVFPALRNTRGKLVLDLGCNKGLWSRHWVGLGALVTGVDFDCNALKTAQQNRLDSRASWPAYANGSAESLPFQADTFQAVICLDVLDIVPRDQQAFQEIFRVLQPGGRLVITVVSRDRRQYFMRVSFAEHIRNYSRDELCDLVVKAGFSIQKEFTFYRRFGGLARELGAWLHQKGLGKIPGFNVLFSLLITGMTYLDILVPELPHDGGLGVVAIKDGQGSNG
jgi:ubiquinone/menaquinone biosynthesis C-methylase UbiE